MATFPVYPFTAFNFSVEINVPFLGPTLCNAAFAECDGLDMTMDVKSIREGGNNTRQIKLVGAVNYGQLTLKRGMTNNFDLWDWFDAQQHGSPAQLRSDLRGDVDVVMLAADHKKELVRFILKKCLLTKLKAPALNAKDGMVAVEEMQITYESMTLKRPA
ncbi:MAG TPA: phage tail protein, partial [Candidatus Polarisedimenticolia bacterium]|nr:phage tail protein [Candidatus Polarisedimenticolia bacterium]